MQENGILLNQVLTVRMKWHYCIPQKKALSAMLASFHLEQIS
jgi:hypothetical protein